MKLQMRTVDSDAIKKIGFSGAKNHNGFRIEFADGRAVDYLDVGYGTYRKFVMSSSQGKFYNDHIRGKFKSR
jgi:KTSC domain